MGDVDGSPVRQARMAGTWTPLARIEGLVRSTRGREVAYRRVSGRNSNQPKPAAKQRLIPRIHISCLTSQAASGRSGLLLAFNFIDCKTGMSLRVIPIMQVFRAKPAWSSRRRAFRAFRALRFGILKPFYLCNGVFAATWSVCCTWCRMSAARSEDSSFGLRCG